nr:serine/arginine repetitive matrix protein 2-like [Penaeus vannamei]
MFGFRCGYCGWAVKKRNSLHALHVRVLQPALPRRPRCSPSPPPQIKKAFHKSESKKEFSVVTNLSTMAVCATSPLLPTAVSSQDLKPHQVVVPHVQVTEVKVPDCYEDPEDALSRLPPSPPPPLPAEEAASSTKSSKKSSKSASASGSSSSTSAKSPTSPSAATPAPSSSAAEGAAPPRKPRRRRRRTARPMARRRRSCLRVIKHVTKYIRLVDALVHATFGHWYNKTQRHVAVTAVMQA